MSRDALCWCLLLAAVELQTFGPPARARIGFKQPFFFKLVMNAYFSNSNVVLKHERRGACSWHPVFGINTIYEIYETTLSGGSLGSCVDEERSQLRELM